MDSNRHHVTFYATSQSLAFLWFSKLCSCFYFYFIKLTSQSMPSECKQLSSPPQLIPSYSTAVLASVTYTTSERLRKKTEKGAHFLLSLYCTGGNNFTCMIIYESCCPISFGFIIYSVISSIQISTIAFVCWTKSMTLSLLPKSLVKHYL